MPFTPNFAIPYQTLADAPDGADLGEEGFLKVDSVLAGVEGRVGALETAVKFTKISESILTGTAASVTFSSIPTTYRSLQLHVLARNDAALTSLTGHIRFNGDTTAIYDTQQMAAFATTASAAEVINGTSGQIGDVSAANAPAGAVSVMVVNIPWYANTSFWKSFISNAKLSNGTGSGTIFSKQWTGRWRNTAAINSVTVVPASNNFIAGSSFALYGLP